MKESIAKRIRYISIFLLVGYLLLLAYLTLFSPHYGRGLFHFRSINIVPFMTIRDYLTYNPGIRIVLTNLAGNIIAFMPLGFLLPIVSYRFRKLSKIIIISFIVTFLIEAAQYIFAVGSSDIDDIILNVVGGVVGYLFYYILSGILRKNK